MRFQSRFLLFLLLEQGLEVIQAGTLLCELSEQHYIPEQCAAHADSRLGPLPRNISPISLNLLSLPCFLCHASNHTDPQQVGQNSSASARPVVRMKHKPLQQPSNRSQASQFSFFPRRGRSCLSYATPLASPDCNSAHDLSTNTAASVGAAKVQHKQHAPPQLVQAC
jgi:hypothetical protein